MLDFFGTTKYALILYLFYLEDQTYGKWTYSHYCSNGVIRLYEVKATMNQAIFCEIQHGRCEQRDLADFAAMTSRENPL